MTKFPEQTHDGNLNRTKVVAQPEAGTRVMAGKTNESDSALKDAKKYAVSAVTTISNSENKGVCVHAAEKQAEGDGDRHGVINGNPKKRTSNAWGIQKDAKA